MRDYSRSRHGYLCQTNEGISMTIAIFGATGQLGSLTIDSLLTRGVAAGDILALGRNQDRLARLGERGVRTTAIDLDDASTLDGVLGGVERVLLISASEPGKRMPQHEVAINVAAAAGVGHLVYTSALQAPTTTLPLAAEHKATEELIAASGIPATYLRNGWYTENHRSDFDTAREHGVISNSVGAGRIASAPRGDYAEAAAVVLTTPGHEGKGYELSGDAAWDFAEFAATAERVLGTPVRYEPLSSEQEREQLRGFGLDDATVGFVVGLNASIAEGTLSLTNGDLASLIGRPTVPLEETLRSWV
jgi:NAD(P)H dehydrogenase (quinone)